MNFNEAFDLVAASYQHNALRSYWLVNVWGEEDFSVLLAEGQRRGYWTYWLERGASHAGIVIEDAFERRVERLRARGE